MGENLSKSLNTNDNKVDEIYRDILFFINFGNQEKFKSRISLNELSEIDIRKVSSKFEDYINMQAQNIQEKGLILNNLIQVGLLRCSGVIKKDKYFYIFTFIENNEDIGGSSFFVETEEELGIKVDTVNYTGSTMKKLANFRDELKKKAELKGLQDYIDSLVEGEDENTGRKYTPDSFYSKVQVYYLKHASELFSKGIRDPFIIDIEYRLKTLYNSEKEINLASMFNDVEEIYKFLDDFGVKKFENRIAYTNIDNIQKSIPNIVLESQGHVYELLKLYLRPVYKD